MSAPATAGESGSSSVERIAREHPGLVAFSRLGWVAKGVVYAVLGIIAVPIALQDAGNDDGGGGSDQASQTGALARVAESGVGVAALWFIAAGLLLYIAWRVVSILLPAENSLKVWATRAGYAVSVVVYVGLASTALSYATDSSARSGNEDARVERWTRDLMEASGGRWLLGVVGAAVIGVGAYFVVRGVTASFRDELDPGEVGPVSHDAIIALGRVGWVGRGLMMAVVGWFVLRAAITFDADEAKGIDGALREATGSTVGSWLVGFVAVALIVYGAFCVISAPRQRLRGAD